MLVLKHFISLMKVFRQFKNHAYALNLSHEPDQKEGCLKILFDYLKQIVMSKVINYASDQFYWMQSSTNFKCFIISLSHSIHMYLTLDIEQ